MAGITDLFGNIEDRAIDRLREFVPPDGYYVAFSGGKDSIVVADLVRRSEMAHELHFNLTTVDPPELLAYIRQHWPQVIWHKPKMTMWQLIVKERMPPTRRVRYCCEELKERGGVGRLIVTGIRWEESQHRGLRRMIETCKRDKTRQFLHPIIDWARTDIWHYIRQNRLPYCSLYDEGFSRIGCIMCPMAEIRRHQDAIRWPKYANAYIRAFQKMVDKRIKDGLPTEWRTGQEVYDWWLANPTSKQKDEECPL